MYFNNIVSFTSLPVFRNFKFELAYPSIELNTIITVFRSLFDDFMVLNLNNKAQKKHTTLTQAVAQQRKNTAYISPVTKKIKI